MVYTEEAFKAELNARGWRATRQREIILQTFQNLPEGTHLSAEELHKKLQEEGHKVSLSTIYRTVKLMTRMGILRELELTEGHKHYEINHPAPRHHHHLFALKPTRSLSLKTMPSSASAKRWRKNTALSCSIASSPSLALAPRDSARLCSQKLLRLSFA
jgi:Fur family ferric uptake transcriptional regulator